MSGYFFAYLSVLLLGELALRYEYLGNAMFEEAFFLLFLPAEAIALTVLSGFFARRKRLNFLLHSLILLVVVLYYTAQCIYFENFGSFLSLGLVGMGADAIGNFRWVILDVLKRKWMLCAALLLPVIVYLTAGIWGKKEKAYISVWQRVLCMVLVFVLGAGSVLIIKSAGTQRGSAYFLMTDVHADSDSSAQRLGVVATTVLEAKRFMTDGKEEYNLTHLTVEKPEAVLVVPEISDGDIKEERSIDSEDILPAEEEIKPEDIYHTDTRLDFEKTARESGDENIDILCSFFGGKEPEAKNAFTGMFEGYNLIYICAESFNTYSLHEKITPLLCKMAESGIVPLNYYTSYLNTTTNGEFALISSLWADTSKYAADGNSVGSFARSADNYMPYGLGTLFKEIGVPTYAYHGYIGSYYRREESWPNLGFETVKFMHDGMEFINKYSPGDTELMEQSVGDYINEERFLAYYMTFSGHGSYSPSTYMYLKNNEAVRLLLADEEPYTDEEIAWYCGSYELEKAMEYLVEELSKAGQLEKTLIVLAGDHIACSLSDEAIMDLSARQGLEYDSVFEQYHSTAIIYTPGLEEKIENEVFCCNVDILPTVLNLLGIEYDSRLFAGHDIFGDGLHRALLYNGNIITEYVKYNSSKAVALWSDKAATWSEEEKTDYLERLISYTESEYDASVAVVGTDFYRYLWQSSGLSE